MLAAYKADIESVYAGDRYGNNIVALYDLLGYLGRINEEPQAAGSRLRFF